jgi:NAD(P)-dependent dehydrogenase (short-subunit alcohol dehydrogenase family)
MSLHGWSDGTIPPQTGRLAVVTGGTSGQGYETALALAQGCADVIIADSSEAQGRSAAAMIRSLAPKALVRFEKLDLADLASVSAFAVRVAAEGRPLDLLVNHAGVAAPRKRQVTADGFEMQLGVNYLGHFALTGLLLPMLRRSRDPRVVQVSSLAHRFGKIRFADMHAERRYRPWRANSQSKLAMLLFARELQRRSDAHGWGLLSLAAHPGYAQNKPQAHERRSRSVLSRLNRSVGQVMRASAADGAQPALFAALSPAVQPGGFYGPGGLFEFAGAPVSAYASRTARDAALGQQLWQVSEQLTGVQWPGN